MKNKNLIIIGVCLVIFSIILFVLSSTTYTAKVILGDKTFNVDVAETKYFLEKGLSGRDGLGTDEGMFFIFKKPSNYGFWMKDMKFPIDIIWIGQDFRIVHIEKSVFPNTYPKVFYPNAPSQYVLEVSAGQSEALNLKNGDLVYFKIKASKNL